MSGLLERDDLLTALASLAEEARSRGCTVLVSGEAGVGKTALLERFAAAAKARGRRRLFLEMRDGNPAETLYRRHGFEPVGRRRAYYRKAAGDPLDAITFARIE